MEELDDLMVKVTQVHRRLSRGQQLCEVWSCVDKVTYRMQLNKLVVDKKRWCQVAGEELAVLWMNGDMKKCTFHIQTEHSVLGSDDRLEHVIWRGTARLPE